MAHLTKRNTKPSSPKSKKRTNKGRDIIRKSKPYDIHKEVYNIDVKFYLGRMESLKADGLYRTTMFGTEVIWNGTKYHFSEKKNRETIKDMFIFAMVKRDAMAYCKKHKTIKPGRMLPAILKNEKIVVGRRKVWPADINDAYWTIAYRLRIISKKTYERGLMLEKRLCNASLAALGSDKSWYTIQKGKTTKNRQIVPGNPKLKLVYAKIRNRCFKYMIELAKVLGKDFIHYKTDCMYYIKTPKNMAKVEKFMKVNKLEYKGGEIKRLAGRSRQ